MLSNIDICNLEYFINIYIIKTNNCITSVKVNLYNGTEVNCVVSKLRYNVDNFTTTDSLNIENTVETIKHKKDFSTGTFNKKCILKGIIITFTKNL